MAWQKRSSGRRYDSLSGHALFVAALTRKLIALATKHKACRYCKMWRTRHGVDEAVPAHECLVNHDGSPGSMEPIAVLDMYKQMYDEHQVIVETLITDDDSTIKAKLKWSNANHMANNNSNVVPTIINSGGNEVVRPDYGEVPAYMPEPTFLADPGHRKKTLKGVLYKLEQQKKADKKTMTKCDCVRISTNFAYMTRTLPGVDESEWVDRGKAVLEHHFDNHEFCGSFCTRKDMSDADRAATTKYYRNKEKDKELYKLLHEAIARFVALDALREVGHGMDTLVNESLNNSIAWLAPKNKTYSMSHSLLNRISVAIAINALGIYGFFQRLFQLLHIDMTPDVAHYLKQVDAPRTYRINKSQETKQKRRRQEKFHDKLMEHTEKAKKERCKREGAVYQPGIGMAKAQQQMPVDTTIRCSSCRQLGHKTAGNKLCRNFKPRKRKQKATASATTDTADAADDDGNDAADNNDINESKDQLRRDARELDLMDAIPLIDGGDEFFDSFEDEDELIEAGIT